MGVYQSKYTGEEIDNLLGENYSTEERKIGTWIDGKPLYETTLHITGSQLGTVNTTNKKIAHNIANADTIWISDGTLLDQYKVGYYLNTHNRGIFIDQTYFYIALTSGSADYSLRTVYARVRYTKTTD